jgi:hypothetical protein
MRQRFCAICLGLLAPLHTIAQEADRPYAALFDTSGLRSSQHEARGLRSTIENEKKQQIETCERDEKRLRAQLDSARYGLKKLNDAAPRDNRAIALNRESLHNNIAALEQSLRDKKRDCEQFIPAEFEIKLAKAHLLERWPGRRAQTIRKIEEGRARDRKHGDVDDIGYRKLVDDQERDVAIGQQAVRQMTLSKLGPVEVSDPVIRQYVQNLAEAIARNSDLRTPLHVTVLDSPEISAIGLPGGFLLISSGLLLASQSEAELAGIISQQIAHIAARHATRTSKRSIISKMFVPGAQVATGLLTGGVSNAGVYYGMNYGFQGMGLLVDRALVSFNASAQKEADQLGIQYAWKAGFDPKGFIMFLDSIAKEKQFSKTDSFFLTKPSLEERLLDAFTEIRYLPPKEGYIVDSPEFQKAKQRLLEDTSK